MLEHFEKWTWKYIDDSSDIVIKFTGQNTKLPMMTMLQSIYPNSVMLSKGIVV